MVLRNALVAVAALAGAAILAPPATADDVVDRGPVLAQTAGQRGQDPHFDPTRGDGPQPHNPNAARTQAGGAPAHFDPPRGDGPQPHRPGAVSGQAGDGAPAHFDPPGGDGLQPHARGRGAPPPG